MTFLLIYVLFRCEAACLVFYILVNWNSRSVGTGSSPARFPQRREKLWPSLPASIQAFRFGKIKPHQISLMCQVSSFFFRLPSGELYKIIATNSLCFNQKGFLKDYNILGSESPTAGESYSKFNPHTRKKFLWLFLALSDLKWRSWDYSHSKQRILLFTFWLLTRFPILYCSVLKTKPVRWKRSVVVTVTRRKKKSALS